MSFFKDDLTDLDFAMTEEEMKLFDKSTFDYEHTIRMSHRFRLSERETAFMINSVLRDLGITERNKFVSQKRVSSMLDNLGLQAMAEQYEEGLVCLQFDGKSSMCLQPNSKEKKANLTTVVSQPGAKYVSHFESRSTGLALANGVIQIIDDTNSRETLVALGCGKSKKFIINSDLDSADILKLKIHCQIVHNCRHFSSIK